jgi:hypothetical protein
MIFLHGFPFDHNSELASHLPHLLALNRNKGLPEVDFVHLNDGFESPRCWSATCDGPGKSGCVSNSSDGSTGISGILGLDDEFTAQGSALNQLCYTSRYCCGQFIVSRRAVLTRSRDFYRLALKLSVDRRDCSAFENLWHVIFRHEIHFSGLGISSFLELAEEHHGIAPTFQVAVADI